MRLAIFVIFFSSPVNDNRASLLRSSTSVRKPVNERDIYMHAWKNYVTFAFRVVPPVPSPVIRCASPDLSLRYFEIIYLPRAQTDLNPLTSHPQKAKNFALTST